MQRGGFKARNSPRISDIVTAFRRTGTMLSRTVRSVLRLTNARAKICDGEGLRESNTRRRSDLDSVQAHRKQR